MKKASERKPPSRARKKPVPMKLVTVMEARAGVKCMKPSKYLTKLLPHATCAKFSSTSTAAVYMHAQNGHIYMQITSLYVHIWVAYQAFLFNIIQLPLLVYIKDIINFQSKDSKLTTS